MKHFRKHSSFGLQTGTAPIPCSSGQRTKHRLSRCARCSVCAESRRLPVKRQMTMIEPRPSITESRPNPSSATELAVIAIAPSAVM